jgi:hypothetical protein
MPRVQPLGVVTDVSLGGEKEQPVHVADVVALLNIVQEKRL